MNNPLQELQGNGQSFWYDNVRRSFTLSGALKDMVDNDGLSGVTSNPTIFQKSISGSIDYDADIEKMVR